MILKSLYSSGETRLIITILYNQTGLKLIFANTKTKKMVHCEEYEFNGGNYDINSIKDAWEKVAQDSKGNIKDDCSSLINIIKGQNRDEDKEFSLKIIETFAEINENVATNANKENDTTENQRNVEEDKNGAILDKEIKQNAVELKKIIIQQKKFRKLKSKKRVIQSQKKNLKQRPKKSSHIKNNAMNEKIVQKNFKHAMPTLNANPRLHQNRKRISINNRINELILEKNCFNLRSVWSRKATYDVNPNLANH